MRILKVMMAFLLIADGLFASTNNSHTTSQGVLFLMERDTDGHIINIRKVKDFDLTGNGGDANWEKAQWNILTKLDTGGQEYESKFKILYSDKGIYILFYAQDNKIATVYDTDFDKLWNGDVFEVFFHSAPQQRKYLEYQVNPLNKELVLIIDRDKKSHNTGLQNYKGKRLIKKKIEVVGGEMEMGGSIRSWSAELFFPFALLKDLPNSPPISGTVWNANFARIDYDTNQKVRWSWTPTIDYTFHELEKFRKIRFD